MVTIIQDGESIARCRKQFIQRFRPFITERIPVKIGHQGASFPAKVLWSSRLDIWTTSLKTEDNRFDHVFGVGRPVPASPVPIACEINFPASGIDRKIGAAFARDSRGRVFVIHRGKIGGGQKGIGKALFENRYRGVWIEMDDNSVQITVAVVGDLSSPRFPRQVAQFVHKVMKIKEEAAAASSPQTTMLLESCRFSEEMTGERHEDLRPDLSRQCDHGLIVRDLAATLSSLGVHVGNDAHRDLFTLDRGNHPAAIFQVTTDPHLKKIHEGVTRLFFSSLSLRRPCRLILALPEPVDPALRTRLNRLNIEILGYAWKDEEAVFPELDTLMATSV